MTRRRHTVPFVTDVSMRDESAKADLIEIPKACRRSSGTRARQLRTAPYRFGHESVTFVSCRAEFENIRKKSPFVDQVPQSAARQGTRRGGYRAEPAWRASFKSARALPPRRTRPEGLLLRHACQDANDCLDEQGREILDSEAPKSIRLTEAAPRNRLISGML